MAEAARIADDRLIQARALLRRHFGFPEFRPGQERVLRSVLAGRDTLAVLPTGAGKSVCFQIPALLGAGLTVVISPLVALMQDQVAAARARGMAARCLNSQLSRRDQAEVRAELAAGAVRLLYVAPERGRTLLGELQQAGAAVSLLAVDEAHCVAEWGPDFRPAFLGLRRLRAGLGSPPCVALTGSATPAVRSAVARALSLGERGGYDLHLGSFDRRNLWFGVVRVGSDRDRLGRLLELLRFDDRIAIVYAPTRNLTEALARVLGQSGFRAAAYHAGLTRERRREVLAAFLDDRLEVVTATCAFGLGIDKPNVRLVVHWTMPPTPEAYYQEAGRAGRDGAPARCVLLYRPGDDRLPRRQLAVTFPDRRLVERAWRDAGVRARLPRGTAHAVARLGAELRHGAVPGGWRRVEERRRDAFARIAAVRTYAEARRCRRAEMLRYFGERLVRCGGCDRCAPPAWPATDPAVRRRVARLATALRGLAGPWNGALVDARAIRGLAEAPPADEGELASRPGIGPELVARHGRTLMAALAADDASAGAPDLSAIRGTPAWARLARWRIGRARELAIPPWRLAPDGLLDRLAERRPTTRRELAGCEGIGPRFLATEGPAVLAALGAGAGEAQTPARRPSAIAQRAQ